MTNEESIKILEAYRDKLTNSVSNQLDGDIEVFSMAIKALETIPKYKDAYNKGWDDGAKATYEHLKMCEEEQGNDLISRDMALEKMADYVTSGYADSVEDFEEYSRIICQLPPVNTQEPKTDVIDKIRTEIEELADADGYGDYQLGFSFGLMMAIEIIDKYRAERSDKE